MGLTHVPLSLFLGGFIISLASVCCLDAGIFTLLFPSCHWKNHEQAVCLFASASEAMIQKQPSS